MRKIVLLFLLSTWVPLQAQITFGPTIAGTQADINYMANGYLNPIGHSLAFSLTNGWYNTAKVKKTLRFEIGFTPSVTFAPEEMQSFTIENSALRELELVNGTSAVTPTVFGDDSPGPAMRYKEPALQLIPGSSFNMPSGLGFALSPMMQAHASIGLPFDFELSARYLPNTGIPLLDGSEIGLWGIGVKHDLLRYIPKGKLLPFSLSGFVSYTRMSFGQDLEPSQNNDKRIDLDASALMARILVSKKLLFITVYGGVGYNQLSSNINVSGTFEYINPGNLQNPETTITDPVSIQTNGGSGLVANLGLRLKFLMLGYISADYTFGKFSAATLSLGVSWDL